MIDFVMNTKNDRMAVIRTKCGGCALELDNIREVYIGSSMHHSPTLHINVKGTVHHIYYDTQEEITTDVTELVAKFLAPVATIHNPEPQPRNFAIHHETADRDGMTRHYLIDTWMIDSYGTRIITPVEQSLRGCFDEPEPESQPTHVLALKDGAWETNIYGTEVEIKLLFNRIQDLQSEALRQPFNVSC